MNTRLVLWVASLLALASIIGCLHKEAAMLKDTTGSKYQVGQVWSYKTRPQEPESTFTVVKVETFPQLGNIIHVSVQGLKINNPRHASGHTDFISRMPYSEEAIDKSVVKLLKEQGELPEYRGGYEDWRKEFDTGEAGIFTISVAEGAEMMEKIVNQ